MSALLDREDVSEDSRDHSVAMIALGSSHRISLSGFNASDHALLVLGSWLRQSGYRFTTITPATHRRVLARKLTRRPTLTDIFGWSRHFAEDDLPESALRQLDAAGVLERHEAGWRSAVRFSSLGEQLYVHSVFPTEQEQAVFFGPDTYRFARAIAQCLTRLPCRGPMRILDLGAGSGAGGLHAATLVSPSPQIVLTDINADALRFCRINAALNDIPHVAVFYSDLYDGVEDLFDVIVANPPYLVDRLERTYRHGGGPLGADLSLRIAEQGLAHLAPGGRLMLYSGAAIVDGVDLLHEALRARLSGRARLAYEEIDPDVFGEELDARPYDRADRIAVVTATLQVM